MSTVYTTPLADTINEYLILLNQFNKLGGEDTFDKKPNDIELSTLRSKITEIEKQLTSQQIIDAVYTLYGKNKNEVEIQSTYIN